MLRVIFYILYIFTFLILCSPCLAQDKIASYKLQLEDIRKTIDVQRFEIRNITKEIASINQEVRQLDQQISKVDTDKNGAKKSLLTLKKEIDKARAKQVGLLKGLERKKGFYIQRIVALYKTRDLYPLARYVLNAVSFYDAIRRFNYLLKVVQSDRSKIIEVTKTVEALKTSRAQLRKLGEKHVLQLNKMTLLSSDLEELRNHYNEMIRTVEVKRESLKQTVLSLEEQAEEIEKILSVMTGDIDSVKVSKTAKRFVIGSLIPPVAAKLTRDFGVQKHSSFSDLLFIKGIELSLDSTKGIRAVANGKVVFAGQLPGYDNIVIIDHGGRYHTLYAKLDNIEVDLEQNIKGGHRIAQVSPKGRGSDFYFEIRYKGQSVNPRRYFTDKTVYWD